jgi:nitrate reductase gamma subunit
MGIVSLIFHILLFITPVFLSAHNIIAYLTIGFSLPVLPERLTDIFTMALMAIGGFLLARRIFIPRVRMISTARDYLILLFVMVPFVSGFLAYHHFFNYHVVIYLHMIIGEIAIMILPFTSLVHMPFIIFSRFYIDSEHSIIPGNRSW